MEVCDVPGPCGLPQHLRQIRMPRPKAGTDQVADVVQAGSGDGGERGDPPGQAGAGDRLPGVDRSPVVSDQVHRAVGTHGVENRLQVGFQAGHPIGAQTPGPVGGTGSPHVEGGDVEAVGQALGDGAPHGAGVRVAVDQHHRKAVDAPHW